MRLRRRKNTVQWVAIFLSFVPMSSVRAAPVRHRLPISFVCRADNDLFRVLTDHGQAYHRTTSALKAIRQAKPRSAVLILAQHYPKQLTRMTKSMLRIAEHKKLHLYVEYPSFIPGTKVGTPRTVHSWERAVVSSNAFSPQLPRLRLLTIHDAWLVPAESSKSDLVLARVAGFNTAVFGLPKKTTPLLFRIYGGRVIIATTKLSHFVTGRYGPPKAWTAVWQHILRWLCPGASVPPLTWTPSVHPTYTKSAKLPPHAQLKALRRGVDWYIRAKVLLDPSRLTRVRRLMKGSQTTPMPPLGTSSGNGSLGILQGYTSKVGINGRQPMTIVRRSDCNAESAMAIAFGGAVFNQPAKLSIARNLLDFWYDKSGACGGHRGDPKDPAYGLIAWGIGSPACMRANYGDDNARVLLATLATAALTHVPRWNDAVTRCLLANLRTTGQLGFRYDRVDIPPLETHGWKYYFKQNNINYSPHFEAYLWACFLWAYHDTGYKLFLKRAKTAIAMTMAAYPKNWRWTNGIQQERARMLLPLAWLVRIDDTPQHRHWLKEMAMAMLKYQAPCGAIQARLGPVGHGMMAPPASNAAYGTQEAPLIQKNGDPVSDLLYTGNFALLGLHEAAAATGNPYYRKAENKLAKYLCRIQVRSRPHPQLDGAWFRAFDYKDWDYWASNSDSGWGAWCVETGWSQAWIASVLAMRQLHTSLWALCNQTHLAPYFKQERPRMLPNNVLANFAKPQS